MKLALIFVDEEKFSVGIFVVRSDRRFKIKKAIPIAWQEGWHANEPIVKA